MSMPVITPSETTLEQAVNDIIESVALEQTALAHILNAEGEKLQAVIAKTDVTQAELLAINESVKNMIKTITLLETVLVTKLDMFTSVVNA